MYTFAAPSVCVDNLKLQMEVNLEDNINVLGMYSAVCKGAHRSILICIICELTTIQESPNTAILMCHKDIKTWKPRLKRVFLPVTRKLNLAENKLHETRNGRKQLGVYWVQFPEYKCMKMG
jgi:hypothetical protein